MLAEHEHEERDLLRRQRSKIVTPQENERKDGRVRSIPEQPSCPWFNKVRALGTTTFPNYKFRAEGEK